MPNQIQLTSLKSTHLHLSIKLILSGLLLSAAMQTVHADDNSAVTLLDNYNLITSGNVTTSYEVEGNALIGGNLLGVYPAGVQEAAGSSTTGYHTQSFPTTSVPALTVVGNVGSSGSFFYVNGPGMDIGGSLNTTVYMNGGGNAYVGSVSSSGYLINDANQTGGNTYVMNNIDGTVITNNGNTVYGGSVASNATAIGNGIGSAYQQQNLAQPENLANVDSSAMADLTAFSHQLAGIAENSSYTTSSISGAANDNLVMFNAVANSSGLAVFTINDANNFFNNTAEIQLNVSSNTKDILVNVINSDPSSALNIHANFLNNAAPAYGSDILWNFENATNLNVSAQFGGSILAVNAGITTTQNIEGSVVAQTLNQGLELHDDALNSNFASVINSSGVASVPLPGSAILFLTGMTGFLMFNRRRMVFAKITDTV